MDLMRSDPADKSKQTVEIDPHAGYCFGVKRAIVMAEDILNKEKSLWCLGDIVHNEEELKRLQQLGYRNLDREAFMKCSGQTLMLRAHGEPPETYEHASKNNINTIDASCPIVKKVQQRIKESYDKGAFIVIFGNPNHPEVIGFNGQTAYNAMVVERVEDLNLEILPDEISLYSQTTQKPGDFQQLVAVLKRAGKKVDVNHTICRHVSNRYPQLVAFCRSKDKIVFVGGRNSSNSHSLFGVAKEINPNTWFVTNADEVDMTWFDSEDLIGVTGATSTPPWLLSKVAEHIANYFKPLT